MMDSTMMMDQMMVEMEMEMEMETMMTTRTRTRRRRRRRRLWKISQILQVRARSRDSVGSGMFFPLAGDVHQVAFFILDRKHYSCL